MTQDTDTVTDTDARSADGAPAGGLAGSRLTRTLSRLGALSVVVLGVAALGVFLLGATGWTLVVGGLLVVAVVGTVLYGARNARKTKTPYWRT
ncbi:hypothetical protein [Halogeometricum limi]|uniref:Uncharacterized protein n=1 Tax=Halogeometricum limi TaxID=555875 RepID=A0A1I6HYA4_9EURY|nr:hypothetical protein [Halogeometricum limi]SFR59445.1 hypothetical protein SAMN04488124_2603 [Halogeometricum limi]